MTFACWHWPARGQGPCLSLQGWQLQGSDSCSFWLQFFCLGSGGGEGGGGGGGGGWVTGGVAGTGVVATGKKSAATARARDRVIGGCRPGEGRGGGRGAGSGPGGGAVAGIRTYTKQALVKIIMRRFKQSFTYSGSKLTRPSFEPKGLGPGLANWWIVKPCPKTLSPKTRFGPTPTKSQ